MHNSQFANKYDVSISSDPSLAPSICHLILSLSWWELDFLDGCGRYMSFPVLSCSMEERRFF